jgi:hypothetical protein
MTVELQELLVVVLDVQLPSCQHKPATATKCRTAHAHARARARTHTHDMYFAIIAVGALYVTHRQAQTVRFSTQKLE